MEDFILHRTENLNKDQLEQQERLTMREAAAYLGVSMYKVRKLIEDGILQAEENILDKRERLILRDQLADLLNKAHR
jgi:excisionase family DNA binding protein